MKKFFSALLLTSCVFASHAMANGTCSNDSSTPVPTAEEVLNGLAPASYEPMNNCCRTGYKPEQAYCHKRGKGWIKCGTRCVYDPYTGGA
ncbi:MAG: hypothetical protein JSU04_07375 [Bdellovibrionales bacterium]|nr:hypothetical protein [Bdellovibrionales bacterium]